MKASTLSAITALVLSVGAFGADPMGTAFTYHGRLAQSACGEPTLNGLYDLRVRLYDVPVGGTQQGPERTPTVPVTNGLFMTSLDFGPGVFAGDARWLEFEVRTNNPTESFVLLSPRQELKPTSYALYADAAKNATTADAATTATRVPWTGIEGLPEGFKDGKDNDTTYSNGAGLTLVNGLFSVDFAGSGSAPTAAHSDHDHASVYAPTTHAHAGEDIQSGLLADDRLSLNIARLNADQTFTGRNQFTSDVNITKNTPEGPTLRLTGAGDPGARVGIDLDTHDPGGAAPASRLEATEDNWSSHVDILTKVPGAPVNPLVSRLRIANNGRVGIGTVSPEEQLHVAGNVRATAFLGEGGGLTALNADNLASGTVPDARLSGNVARLDASQTFTGPNTLNHPANAFTGDGSGLTELNANNIAAGILAEARIDAAIARDSEILPTVLAQDGPGSGLDADLLDGLEASAFAAASHNHYGETWSGSAVMGLSVHTDSTALEGVAALHGRHGHGTGLLTFPAGVSGESLLYAGVQGASQSGSGVFGQSATQYGVYGRSESDSGVVGWAAARSGLVHGVYGRADSREGNGVYGMAMAATGASKGVVGASFSTEGCGVEGVTGASSGATDGVRGISYSTSGVGVRGEANAATGSAVGVRGRSLASDGGGVLGEGQAAGVVGRAHAASGVGVSGVADHTSGPNYGVFGRSDSTIGHAVHGDATALSGATCGVYGRSSSPSGTGVHGEASAASGYGHGVFGASDSPDGIGVLGWGAGVALKASGSGIIQSTADSYVFVPAVALVKSGSADTTRLEVQVSGAVHVYRGATAGAKTVRLPITMPAVLYGQPVTVEQLTVYYKCYNGANNYITGTVLMKQVDADTGAVLINDGTDRTSNSATSYTLIPTSGNVLSSEQGLLCLSLTLEFANDSDYVRIAGVRLRLSHD